jgi:hypothetical protein
LISYSVKAITSLTYSPLRKYVLCVTDDAGSVVLYDVKAKAIAVAFHNAHSAPATAAAFSPTNKVLS